MKRKMAQNEVILLEAKNIGQNPMVEDDNIGAIAASDPNDGKMGLRQCFYDFCKQTALHGWNYLAIDKAGSKSKVSKKPNSKSGNSHVKTVFHSAFWTMVIMASVLLSGFFLHDNTVAFFRSTVITTLDTHTVPLSEIFFPSVVVCNINQIRKSFFAELGFYKNDTLVQIMYEDFIKGTTDAVLEDSQVPHDPKRDELYNVSELNSL